MVDVLQEYECTDGLGYAEPYFTNDSDHEEEDHEHLPDLENDDPHDVPKHWT